MPSTTEKVLILTKTYPNPSARYQETVCVAGVNEAGELRRIYPVPFRRMHGDQRFARWQWVTANFSEPRDDRRPDSRRVDADSIQLGQIIGTQKQWKDRLAWIEPHVLPSFDEMEQRRQTTQQTLGCLRVSRLLGLDITPRPAKERQWSSTEIQKLTQDLMQAGLFDTDGGRKPPLLEKIPYTFHYRYEVDGAEHRHIITDWEASALYRTCQHSHGEKWEVPFRTKLEQEFSQKDLYFLMGTTHRFPEQWLIIGLIYPPRLAGNDLQATLDLFG